MSEPRAGCLGWLLRPLRRDGRAAAAAPADDRTGAWSEAAERGDWRWLAELLHATREPDAERSEAASEALALLVPRIPSARLRDAAQAMRADDATWKAVGMSALARFDEAAHLAGVLALTLHSSGYVRERALRTLAHRPPDPLELPFLLERAVESVQPVRVAAETALARHLAPRHAHVWVAHLGELRRLERRERFAAARLLGSVAKVLLAPEAGTALDDALRARSRATVEVALAIAAQGDSARHEQALGLAVEHADPLVRAHATRAWLSAPPSAARTAWLARARVDRSLFVRREALRADAVLPTDERRELLRRALFDPCAPLRSLARHEWKLAGHADAQPPLELYRAALADTDAAVLAAAASGIGECGAAADARALEPLVDHAVPRVASAALRAIAQLDGAARVDWLLARIDDPRSGVARAAAAGISKRSGAEPAALRAVVERARHARARRHALSVLLARNPYDALVDALELARHPEPAVAQQARAWLERLGPATASHAPTPQQEQRARVALASFGAVLTPATRERIERLLWGARAR